MKIKIRYDDKLTYLEVSEEDVTILIDIDYKERLSSAEDKEEVKRRSPEKIQEIVDELLNRPDYNSWHKLDRHRGMPKKPFRKNDQPQDTTDHMDYIADYSDEDAREKKAEYKNICDIIRKTLKPNQAELIIAIYIDGVSVTEYANSEGVSKSAISHRLKTAKKNFKKIFPDASSFSSFYNK